MRRRTPQPASGQHPCAGEWSPARLRLLLAVTLVVLCALAGRRRAGSSTCSCRATPTRRRRHRDTASPRTPTPPERGAREPRRGRRSATPLPGPLTTDHRRSITLPAGTRIGPPASRPASRRTREGALAQLIALDRAALEALSVPRAQDVIARVGGTRWTRRRVVDGGRRPGRPALRRRQPATGTTACALRADAAMGSVRPTPRATPPARASKPAPSHRYTRASTRPHPDHAAASSSRSPPRTASDDLATRDRWVIAAGPEPAPSPSVWPGTQAALDAGYRWLEVAP